MPTPAVKMTKELANGEKNGNISKSGQSWYDTHPFRYSLYPTVNDRLVVSC